jgi:hypothetical protein
LYVGSTTNYEKREKQHMWMTAHPENKKCLFVNKYIHANGGWDAWNMSVLENYPCENRHALRRREGYWVKLLQPNLNRCIPGRTFAEWFNDTKAQRPDRSEYLKNFYLSNKEVITEKHKQYYEANKEIIAEKHKLYRETNKDSISEYHRIYFVNNTEKIAKRGKKYYETHKCSILQKQREAHAKSTYVTCVCGRQVLSHMLTNHKKSKAHVKFTTNAT